MAEMVFEEEEGKKHTRLSDKSNENEKQVYGNTLTTSKKCFCQTENVSI